MISSMLSNAFLGSIPSPGDHINLFKLATVVVLFIGWTVACQWVDCDAENVKTKRERWNLTVLLAGVLGLVLLILPPWTGSAFFLGIAFWILLSGGGLLTYILHRNGRVVPDQRVLTIGHFKRLIARDDSLKVAKLDRGQRINLSNSDGTNVSRPLDRDEAAAHDVTQDFLFDILWRRVSEADLTVGQEKTRLIYKIDGVVSERTDGPSPEDAPAMLQYLKTLAGLNPEEIRRPQEGQILTSLLAEAGDQHRVTVITSGSTMGERLRLKVYETASQKRLGDLGMHPRRLEKLKSVIEIPKGLVLVSGLRGSGVTTTQYSILRTHDAFIQNIHMLEKRPLYELDNITQAVHDAANQEIGYARQLQSVLRREPDVVGVGECEDRDTARIAVRAATEHRKVYLAIEGKTVFDSLSRLAALTEDPKLVAAALLAVLNQRLIRILCSSCRQAFKPDEKLLRKANIPADKVEHFHRPPTEPVFDRKGREIICQACQGSGYVGRVGIFEILFVDDEIRELIATGAAIKQIKLLARKKKMYNLDEEGLLRVIDGTTSLDEVIRSLRDDKK